MANALKNDVKVTDIDLIETHEESMRRTDSILLVDAQGMVYEVPAEMLWGTKMSNWVERQEDILELFQDLREVLKKMQEFRDDVESEQINMACCGCAMGGSSAVNLCKWDR